MITAGIDTGLFEGDSLRSATSFISEIKDTI